MLKGAGEAKSALSALVQPFGGKDVAFLQTSPGVFVLLVLSGLAAAWQWRARRSALRPEVLLPLLLAAMIVLHGHFVFSPAYWAYRYDAYLVGFGVLVAAVLAAGWARPRLMAAGWWPALLSLSLVPVVADVREGVFPAAEIAGVRRTYLEHYQAAQLVRSYHADDVVIVNDLGAISYFTENRILDLVGLGDVEPLEIMRKSNGRYTSADVQAWTSKQDPKIAIVQLGWSFVAPLVPREWIQVAEVEVPGDRHRLGLFAVDPKRAWVLRASAELHYGALARPLGYRIALRPPAEMDALVAGAPPGRRWMGLASGRRASRKEEPAPRPGEQVLQLTTPTTVSR
jgi:hypothetical protein